MPKDKRDVNEPKNFGPNLATSQDECARALQHVKDCMEPVRAWMDKEREKWTVLQALWQGEPVTRFFPGMDTTHVPESMKVVESIMPRLREGMFPSPDWFRVRLLRDGKGDPGAIKALLEEQLAEGRFEQRMDMFLRSLCIFGTAFAKVPWVPDTAEYFCNEAPEEEVWENGTLVGMKRGPAREKTYKVNRDRTEFVPLHIADFFCDPRYNDISKAPWNADEMHQSAEYVLDRLKEGVYAGITAEEVKKMAESGPVKPTAIMDSALRYLDPDTANVKRQPADDFTTLEWWGLYDLKKDGHRVECVIAILNGERAVRVQENKLWHRRRPYLGKQYIPIKDRLYGIGLIEPIVRLQQDLNDTRNSLNLASALLVNPMLKAGDDAGVEEVQMTAVPGKIWRCGDISQLQVLYMPDVTQVGRLQEAAIRQDIQEVTGATRLYYGSGEEGGTTATEVFTRVREANSRLKGTIKALARDVVEPFLEMAHYNNHQFLREERMILQTGNTRAYTHLKVTPDKLAGPAKFEMLLAPQIELLGIRGQQMMAFVQQVAANPVSAQVFDWPKFLRRAYEDIFGYRDVDEIFIPLKTAEAVSQAEECMLMAEYGYELDVQESDPHAEHLRYMLVFMSTRSFNQLPPDRKAVVVAHAKNHELFAKRMAEVAASQPAAPQMAGPQGGMPPLSQMGGPPQTDNAVIARQLAEEQRMNLQGT